MGSSRVSVAARIPPGEPLRAFGQLDAGGGVPDRLLRVEGARLVYLDHALLAHDLPPLRDDALVAAGEDPVDFRERWFLDNAALISLAQTGEPIANTPIRTGRPAREGFRPPRYGRAAIVEAVAGSGTAESLLLDLKGAGCAPGRAPSLAPHASGLCALREVLREAFFEAMISAVLGRAAPDLWTLPVYGVIDLGFDLKTHRGEQLEAGLLVRRAHRRTLDDASLPWRGSGDERLRLEIELLLRAYGITSANAATRFHLEPHPDGLRIGIRDEPRIAAAPAIETAARTILGVQPAAACDGINVQLARIEPAPGCRAQLVDFGHYEIRKRFEPALVSMTRDGPHQWGASLAPDHPYFVQPFARLAEPLSVWARESEAEDFGTAPRSAVDPLMRQANAAARAFRRGALEGRAIARMVSDVRLRAGC